jgi:arogenate dehydrogenase (NADP+), plant
LLLFALCDLFIFIGGNAFMSTAENIGACPTTRRNLEDNTAIPATRLPDGNDQPVSAGRLEKLKQRETELSRMLAEVRSEKLSAIRSRPLTIGIIGFGRFGQFIARSFQKYGNVVVTSRSDYTDIANGMGVKYISLSDPAAFLDENLDVIVVAVSILSFGDTLKELVPHLKRDIEKRSTKDIKAQGPLIVDVLSVKEHARQVMLDLLPPECDILCTHPMFGPDSGKDSWFGLNFVYEKTRIDNVVLYPNVIGTPKGLDKDTTTSHIEGMDRMERFLSIWEEEGCRMIPMTCHEHDAYAANSQFVTHLMGRILGTQGLAKTPIDTKGFESVLKVVDSTTADSFDLFYGLYKYNQNSMDTIVNLRSAMDEVVEKLRGMDKIEN